MLDPSFSLCLSLPPSSCDLEVTDLFVKEGAPDLPTIRNFFEIKVYLQRPRTELCLVVEIQP
jgi:hypothetical protein